MDGCEGILDMWYADMATCIFNHFILESDACSLAGLCYEKSAMAKGGIQSRKRWFANYVTRFFCHNQVKILGPLFYFVPS